ncbi:uncharacterized protein LAJ45_06667 [Morchella importuna]|uniref:uncharacterized protein n=1 Tax=Morchella importuna TaxID=1174673 RepID=UPI001E8CF8A5|nr:uncharacterized protein LAJ45_06667 [Morchella importuna]KAH8149128.1 hypothetical protein LAJ45_06667 [Morchella importuna]
MMILSSNNVLVRPPLGSTGILFEAAIDADQSCFRSTNQGRATCSVSELGVMLASRPLLSPRFSNLEKLGLSKLKSGPSLQQHYHRPSFNWPIIRLSTLYKSEKTPDTYIHLFRIRHSTCSCFIINISYTILSDITKGILSDIYLNMIPENENLALPTARGPIPYQTRRQQPSWTEKHKITYYKVELKDLWSGRDNRFKEMSYHAPIRANHRQMIMVTPQSSLVCGGLGAALGGYHS